MALTNEQYNQMMREYDARRFQALRDMEIRKETVYKRFPKLLTVQDRIAENAASRARARIQGNDGVLPALDEESKALRAEKEQLLMEFYEYGENKVTLTDEKGKEHHITVNYDKDGSLNVNEID